MNERLRYAIKAWRFVIALIIALPAAAIGALLYSLHLFGVPEPTEWWEKNVIKWIGDGIQGSIE